MITLKNLFIIELKIIKYLFYDMIPELYDVKWYKHDFDSNIDYYFLKPVIYLVMLIVSLLDIYALIYRIVYLTGVMKEVLTSGKTSK